MLKIYDTGESENNALYQYQLDHYLKTHPSQEEVFFKHVHDWKYGTTDQHVSEFVINCSVTL
ncbi:MAG: hypothetical protein NVSMB24_19620 [Mucilaginibacter sp.]